MASQIAAHVTVTYPAEVPAVEQLTLRASVAATEARPFRLILGRIRCFARPEDGLYVEVIDDDGGGRALRDRIGAIPKPVEVEPHATEAGIIAAKPWPRLPTPRRNPSKRRYLAVEELVRLLAALSTPQDRLLIRFPAETGLRISELKALRWGDLELDGEPVVSVSRRHRLLDGEQQTKSERCSGTVPITRELARELKSHRMRNGQPPREAFVFTGPDGKRVDEANYRRRVLDVACARRASTRSASTCSGTRTARSWPRRLATSGRCSGGSGTRRPRSRSRRTSICSMIEPASTPSRMLSVLVRSAGHGASLLNMSGSRRLKLRRPDRCVVCEVALAPGTVAFWDASAKTVTCLDCLETARANAEGTAMEPAPVLERGIPGASARRRYERLHTAREERAREKFGRLSGLYLAMTSDPQSTVAWAQGSRGERLLGQYLEETRDDPAFTVLHDRRIPGTRRNIDHIAVTRSGAVWAIDAKNYRGKVQRIDKGGWFSTDLRLYVGRRDCTKLVHGVARQVDAICAALDESVMREFGINVRAALCFVNAEWSLFAKPFELGSVWIGWPKALGERLRAPGKVVPEQLAHLAHRVANALPPA